MATKNKSGSGGGSSKSGPVRNPDRRNGKAWGKHHRLAFGSGSNDKVGHNLTGRTKPSGSSACGYSMHKIHAMFADESGTADVGDINAHIGLLKARLILKRKARKAARAAKVKGLVSAR